MLLNVFLNWASNAASVLLNTYNHHYTETNFRLYLCVSMPRLRSVHMVSCWSIFHFHFIAINHTKSSKETHLSFLFSLEYLLLFLDDNAGFDFTTRDSYFNILVEVFTNHILAKKTCFTDHLELADYKIIVLKPGNKYRFIWKCHSLKSILIDVAQHHSFRYRVNAL